MSKANVELRGHDRVNSSGERLALLYLRVSTVKQATRGGQTEGYSIPAQRAACLRKASDLGAVVLSDGEFLDAGASARSADRSGLQAMLTRLSDKSLPPIAYVIVHKIDRLARDRADDVAIGLAIHKSGATLVSATEAVDDTPAGTLLHGIMASIAEFYSKNLAAEVKKGQKEKVLRGGTPGYVPLGYLNTVARIDGREVRGVAVDPERAPLIQWAYETYAAGQHSITDLLAEITSMGMTNRPTTSRPGKPLVRAQLHRMLTSRYYLGKVNWSGIEYEGSQEPLIDINTFTKVQAVLSDRRIAGDRSWRHDHYLKGTLRCGLCQSIVGLTNSTGKSGEVYSYFYCIGRNKKRAQCDLPFLPIDLIEQKVAEHWKTVHFPSDFEQRVGSIVTEIIEENAADGVQILKVQKIRLQKLDRARQKLIDAYLAEAISTTELKKRQDLLAAEQNDAERLVAMASRDKELFTTRLDESLRLLTHAAELYVRVEENAKRTLNQVFFEAIYLSKNGVEKAPLNPLFAALSEVGTATEGQTAARSEVLSEEVEHEELDPNDAQLAQDDDETSTVNQVNRGNRRDGQNTRGHRKSTKQNTAQKFGRCSNLTILAEEVGFEPTVGCPTHAFQACRFGRSRTPPESRTRFCEQNPVPETSGSTLAFPCRLHEPLRSVRQTADAHIRRFAFDAVGRGWSGPAQGDPSNRVRAGRQQLSVGNLLCRR
jgi:site-specific DNA recombinase